MTIKVTKPVTVHILASISKVSSEALHNIQDPDRSNTLSNIRNVHEVVIIIVETLSIPACPGPCFFRSKLRKKSNNLWKRMRKSERDISKSNIST